MIMILNMILVLVILINLFALGAGRMKSLIHAAAAQGVLLGLLPPLAISRAEFIPIALALATVVLKGVVIPKMLLKALRDAQVKREVEPLIGFMPSILLGAAATAVALALAGYLTTAKNPLGMLVIPTSISMLFTGFMLLTTRVKAITQTIGFLLLENGIFVFGLLLLGSIPYLVELGVLLDLFVAIFIISIILHHINREFASLDTRRLSSLKG